MDNNILNISKALLEKAFELPAQQKKIFLYTISKNNPLEFELLPIEFNLNSFCIVCGINPTPEAFESITNDLIALSNNFICEDLTEDNEFNFKWFSNVSKSEKDNTFIIQFDENLKYHILPYYSIIQTIMTKSEEIANKSKKKKKPKESK